jgi:HlyD family secretion protein
VTRGDVVQKVEATGTVQPVDSVEVGAQVTGTIKTLGATFNSEVRKGQILATLDPASLQAEVDQARANLVRLQAQYEQAKVALEDASIKLARAERLSRDQLIAQADFDVARVTRDGAQAALKSADAQVVQARASLAQTQVALQHTVITSPTDGIVLARNVEVGQTVTSGLQTPTLFVIARDLGTMQVSASVDESDIGRVAKGQPVTFTTDAYAGERVLWHRLRGATAAGGHPERGDLHDDHHRAEPWREAQAGHGRRRWRSSRREYPTRCGFRPQPFDSDRCGS